MSAIQPKLAGNGTLKALSAGIVLTTLAIAGDNIVNVTCVSKKSKADVPLTVKL